MLKDSFLILLLMLCIHLESDIRDIAAVDHIAERFLIEKNRTETVRTRYTIAEKDKAMYHVCCLVPTGFIVVSADLQSPEIIAYSFKESLNQEDYSCEDMHLLLTADLKLRRQFYHENPNFRFLDDPQENTRSLQWPVEGSTSTDGWIEQTWHQTGIYNDMCPLDDYGERCLTGCVATALSMILDYHQYIGDSIFNDEDDYTSWAGFEIDDDFDERDFPPFPLLNYNLDLIRNRFSQNEALDETCIAALNFASGVALEMNYGSDISTAWIENIPSVLLSKFGFNSAEYLSSISGMAFYNQLKSNMQNMQPAILKVYRLGFTDCHAIVCDGYNSDNFYHLNFGWGNSNATCWYSLPAGMPANYTILHGGVLDIEGGISPVQVNGIVNNAGGSVLGTHLRLEGEYFYECWIDNEDGLFTFSAVSSGLYNATASLRSRVFYDSFEIEISEDNNQLVFELGDFSEFTGYVTAPVNPENTSIVFLQDNEVIYSATVDHEGFYCIPEVLPGEYQIFANLNDSYLESKQITVTEDHQTEDLDLKEYNGDLKLAYSNFCNNTFDLNTTEQLDFAIRLTSSELINCTNDVISGIKFKSPISSFQGEIIAKLWMEDELISSKQVNDLLAGEWKEANFANLIPILPEKTYYVGYSITTDEHAKVYHDSGPYEPGKGAFLKNEVWEEIDQDLNFCFEAIIKSANYGTICGNVIFNSSLLQMEDTAIKADNFIAHPDVNGAYELDLKPGYYDITAAIGDFTSNILAGVYIQNEQIIEDQNLVINLTVSDDIIQSTSCELSCYPNPFNPSTTISFSLTTEITQDTEINIYNLKGQKVKNLPLECNNYVVAASSRMMHSIQWNGTDNNGNAVASGVYYVRLQYQDSDSSKKTLSRKVLLLK